ncbi:lytic transglycosylase domain-containing protein [Saccharopolyspora shandongensis]|uniref:lytic transglycosylase domain-containing protein n=1 Tax=Saccharopolyspora shandongensis TaxID=418495 RepID=UPI0033E448B8
MSAPPQQVPPEVSIDGRLPMDEQLSGRFLEEQRTNPDIGARVEPGQRVPAGALGIPGPVLAAYQAAERTVARTDPRCGLHWAVLAAIGRIESGHARSGRVDASGRTTGPILGPRLDGAPGIAAIADTDGGRLDGDTVWDRAVGPMQFIPSTWRRYAADGNGDGNGDPHNVYDATLAAGQYLCSGGGNLRDRVQLATAVFRYNHSQSYVRTVLAWADAYAHDAVPVPAHVGLPDNVSPLARAAPAPPPPGAPLPPGTPLPPPPPGSPPSAYGVEGAPPPGSAPAPAPGTSPAAPPPAAPPPSSSAAPPPSTTEPCSPPPSSSEPPPSTTQPPPTPSEPPPSTTEPPPPPPDSAPGTPCSTPPPPPPPPPEP